MSAYGWTPVDSTTAFKAEMRVAVGNPRAQMIVGRSHR